MMICMNCGNRKNFTRRVYGTSNWSEERLYDGESEDIEDYGDRKDSDSSEDDQDSLTCVECSSQDCEEGLDEKEIEEIEWKHTTKEGGWEADEIPLEERRAPNARLLLKSVKTKIEGGA